MVDTAETAGPGERLHDLLLSLAGRVDDDAVNTSREMLGTGHHGTAAEFLLGCLLAGRIPVSAEEQRQLRLVLGELRCPREFAERLHVVDAVPDSEHRFSEQHSSGGDLVQALDPISGRLSGVRGLWCAWRTTPAGVTYGAVPQRILLAEVGPDGSVVAAGYQLVEALRRAGISCAVDVFATGADLPTYHRDALGSARRVHLDLPAGAANGHASPNHGRAPRMSSSGEPAGVSELSDAPLTPPPDLVPEEFRFDEPPTGEPVGELAAEEPALTGEEQAAEWLDRGAGAVPEPGPLADVPRSETAAAETAADEVPGSEIAGAEVADNGIADARLVTEPAPVPEPAFESTADSDATGSAEVAEHPDEQTFEEAVEELAGTAPTEQDAGGDQQAGNQRAGDQQSGERGEVTAESEVDDSDEPAGSDAPAATGDPDSTGEADEAEESQQDESNMRVPAAVDAKLTDRERNLLRKLHEELAQREHDRDGNQRPVANQSWSEMPGTGGFPSLGAGSGGRPHRRQ